jgi:hypothetical protein
MFILTLFCIICLFLPQYLTKQADDHCSQFNGYLGNPLVECPTYDLDHNYYECYDANFKANFAEFLNYWCWNRLDNDETILKNLTISTAYVNDDVLFQQINQPFSSMIHRNETHAICGSNENWAVPYKDANVYCPTSTGIPVAQFIGCGENLEW